ncbi:UDP-N-acetylmuramate dehydrogenase [Janibacter sp. G1551]|uniref:UDP-N-acetylmuramate dehydrogenase n=1 Tax=Janibacter sp. G1551 TaxID=3420440 RepID=UPI003D05A9FF
MSPTAVPTSRTEEFDAPLAELTTMRVGGPAARLVTVTTTDELVDAVREVDDADEPLLVLSGGSNLVIGDEGFPGTVVRIATSGIAQESADHCGGAMVRVAAGEVWDDVVARAVVEGWAGIEALSGIPGLAGATPVQNVGAYGQDVSQTIASVRVWDRQEQSVRTIANADCAFTYRHSLFKGTDRYVVLDVLFQFEIADLCRPIAYADLARQLGVEQGDRVPLADAREAVLAQRRRRGMVLDESDHDTWSCGSFFTNPILSPEHFADLAHAAANRLGPDGPVPPQFPEPDGRIKTSAAWLIDKAGFVKGHGMPGPAALSTKHTLAVTNRGGASAAQVADLAREVRDGVAQAFGVTLVNEPVFVGHSL